MLVRSNWKKNKNKTGEQIVRIQKKSERANINMDDFRIIALCCSMTGILFHIIGIVLLITENRRKSRQSRQQGGTRSVLLLVNISISDIAFSIQNIIRSALQHYQIKDIANASAIMDVMTYSLGIPFYCGMFLLTIQRFLEVYLHLKYYRCWFEKRQSLLCLTTWCAGLLFAVSLIVVHKTQLATMVIIQTICRIVSIVMTFVVILEFIFVYSYIFRKFHTIHYKNKQKAGHHIVAKRRRRRIYIPFFIVMTFIIFIGIPDFISVFFAQFYSKFIYIFYYVNVIVDALIYIALKPTTRSRFKRSMLHLPMTDLNINKKRSYSEEVETRKSFLLQRRNSQNWFRFKRYILQTDLDPNNVILQLLVSVVVEKKSLELYYNAYIETFEQWKKIVTKKTSKVKKKFKITEKIFDLFFFVINC